MICLIQLSLYFVVDRVLQNWKPPQSLSTIMQNVEYGSKLQSKSKHEAHLNTIVVYLFINNKEVTL